jgi:hypothetical protein
MMKLGWSKRWWAGAVVVMALIGVGCASSPRLPEDAKLIWSGKVEGPGHLWKDIYPGARGQVYLVDHDTGQVKGVDSVWEGKQNFSFQKPTWHRVYDLYFVQDKSAATTQAGK